MDNTTTSPRPSLTAADTCADVAALRQASPLVLSITNWVVMNYNANALLAAGASPIMAHAHEEVRDMTTIAQAVVLNIGTLEPYWVDSMGMAIEQANTLNKPVVLDPVGAGASTYRNSALAKLLQQGSPSVIRGNASEIMSVAGLDAATKGVDSSHGSDDALASAKALAKLHNAVVCISGETDYVVDQHGRQAALRNGHDWMTKVTGMGCSASALVGAFCAVQPDLWRATVSAMSLVAVAGEVAVAKAQLQGAGVGTLQTLWLDQLQLLDAPTLTQHLKLQVS